MGKEGNRNWGETSEIGPGSNFFPHWGHEPFVLYSSEFVGCRGGVGVPRGWPVNARYEEGETWFPRSGIQYFSSGSGVHYA